MSSFIILLSSIAVIALLLVCLQWGLNKSKLTFKE